MTPSHWSHAILAIPTEASTLECWHIPLSTEHGYAFPPTTNGVQPVDLERYAVSREYPNVAVIHVPVVPLTPQPDPPAQGRPARRQGRNPADTARLEFTHGRGSLDAIELVWAWLGFAWGAAKSGNPLLNGVGVPSAVLVEQVLAALLVDITPGLASRASCPEAIWQAARWWHGYYRTARDMDLAGHYCVDNRLVPDGDTGRSSRMQAAERAASRRRK